MGINITQLALLASLRDEIKSSRIALISVQYPPDYKDIRELTKNTSIITTEELEILSNCHQRNFAEVLFKEVFGASHLNIFDIDGSEGADVLVDLGRPIQKQSVPIDEGSYDFVVEGGTLEHIFDTKVYITNLFKLLKNSGKYISSSPSSGHLNHGFYQFSPTWFIDFVSQNSQSLKLDLALMSGVGRPFWLCKSNLQSDAADRVIKKALRPISFGRCTNVALSVIDASAARFMNEAVIVKSSGADLNFSVSQGIYSGNTLEAVLPFKDNPIKELRPRKPLREIIKKIFVNIPLPVGFKLFVLQGIAHIISPTNV
jgi:hypothetical protein